jgi:hypothetical protein
MTFLTGGGTERMRIDSSGNVGIGTTNPTSLVHLSRNNAELYIDGGAGSYNLTSTLRFARGYIQTTIVSGTAYGDTRMAFGTQAANATAERMFIDENGNFSIPTSYNHTTASGANVFFRSDGYLQRSTSALKYKQDIRDLENMDISLLRPVRYKSKCASDDQTKDHLGLIADETAEAGFEELVSRNADGEVEGFQYERLTVVLLKAMQTQSETIKQLQADVTALKGNV